MPSPADYGLRPDQGIALNNSLINAGVTAFGDVDCLGARNMSVIYRLRGTITGTDLTNFLCRTYSIDGTTLGPFFPTTQSQGVGTFNGDLYAFNSYELRGLRKVRPEFKNNSAGALNGDIYYFLGY